MRTEDEGEGGGCCGGGGGGAAASSELDVHEQTGVFLELRKQNVELLKVAAQIAGFGGSTPPGRGDDTRQAMEKIWNIYSELYEWIDPEEDEDEDEDEDEE
jgi:hypothetical protein